MEFILTASAMFVGTGLALLVQELYYMKRDKKLQQEQREFLAELAKQAQSDDYTVEFALDTTPVRDKEDLN